LNWTVQFSWPKVDPSSRDVKRLRVALVSMSDREILPPPGSHAAQATGQPGAAPECSPGAEPCPPKRRKILDGARQVFLEVGFERASVDTIAARAGVAKATVYNHFDDKAALFVASFSEHADDMRARFLAELTEPEGDVGEALRRVGEQIVSATIEPGFVSAYRQACAEVERFPEIGRTLFERGPTLVYQRVAAYLGKWVERGALRIPDVDNAAIELLFLIHGNLFVRAQLGVLSDPDGSEVRAAVRRGVDVFLRAYR
jgi:TetR/AcrR family transcriptional repressor of mexJK operon